MGLSFAAAAVLAMIGLGLGVKAKSIFFVIVLTALTFGVGFYMRGANAAVVGVLLLQCGYVAGLLLSHSIL